MTAKYIDTLDYSQFLELEKDYPKFNYEKAVEILVFQSARDMRTVAKSDAAIEMLKEWDGIEDKTKTAIWKKTVEKLNETLENGNVEKLIPKEYWCDISSLIGPSVRVSGHQHILFGIEKMIEISLTKKRADILIVVPCSFSKPYSKNNANKKLLKASRETGIFDVMVASIFPATLTPFDASVCYPCAFYSTPLKEISDMWSQVDERLISKHLVEIIRRLGYKKVIFAHYGQNHLNVKHLIEEYGFPRDFIVEPYKIELYNRAHRFRWSTMDLPEPKRFYPLISSRWGGGVMMNCFMRDIFGSSVYPYFPTGWDELDPKIKEYCGYSKEAVEKVKDEVGIKEPSNLVEFLW